MLLSTTLKFDLFSKEKLDVKSDLKGIFHLWKDKCVYKMGYIKFM